MIISWIINSLLGTVNSILFILPNLPAASPGFQSALDSFMNTLTKPIGILQMIYSPGLLTLIVSMLIVLLNLTLLYQLAMWLLAKIPTFDIH